MQVGWNGTYGPVFSPTRGIRQGDPMSPYLFVLMMEKLAHLIQGEVQAGNWLPFRLNNNGTRVSHLFFADDLFLFAEASTDQAAIVKACLDDFCSVSGEKVNNSKSRVFFSTNVSHSRRQEISSFLEFTVTPDLGKYLGVPLQHKRITKQTYKYILDKMDTRLAGWKTNCLSMAARHTLISSVVSTIPAYSMQTSWLPVHIWEAIDKKCRGFLWGNSRSHKKVHLVAWEDVCRFKDEGGLSLKSAKLQNTAFMMKLGWGLVKQRDSLWVRFMREKYKCGNDIVPSVVRRRNMSRIWKGICSTWDKTKEGIGWTLGNGRHIRFWLDAWLPNHNRLIDYSLRSIPEELKEVAVCDFLTVSGGWDWSQLYHVLPRSVVESIARCCPSIDVGAEDLPRWILTHSGAFSVRFAYTSICSRGSLSSRSMWRNI